MISHRVVLAVIALSITGGCRTNQKPDVPVADLLLVAGDSTYWIANDSAGFAARRSPILLARYGGRFYEVFVADDDRSFYDAVIVGQRVYRRDIITGDSVAAYEDPSLADLASSYVEAHPGARPLGPDEDASDDPSMSSMTETDIIDVVGPFVTIEQRADMDLPDGRELLHTTRSVVDLRTAHALSIADLVGENEAKRVLQEARKALQAAFDSVRRSRDARARVASGMLRGFIADDSSFALLATESGPVVAFLVPGQGPRAGGYALPLPPQRIPGGDWWTEVREALPTQRQPQEDVWSGATYDVVVRYDSAGDDALVVLRDKGKREYPVTRVPLPVSRVFRLETLAHDSVTMHALKRAFDDADAYSRGARTTMNNTLPGALPTAVHP